eukprot:gene7223-1609_t
MHTFLFGSRAGHKAEGSRACCRSASSGVGLWSDLSDACQKYILAT